LSANAVADSMLEWISLYESVAVIRPHPHPCGFTIHVATPEAARLYLQEHLFGFLSCLHSSLSKDA
jgi:hypothetical protein